MTMACGQPQYVGADSPDLEESLVRAMREDGVVVVTGVIPPEECDRLMDELVGAFEALFPGVARGDPGSWAAVGLPPQTRTGLFQATVGNLRPVWRLRCDPRVACLFAALYSRLGGQASPADLVVSGDGLNLRPNGAGPFAARDWPHLDQTWGGAFRCFQGQAVLTTTTACLVASLGSHRVHEEILRATGGTGPGDWRKFTPEQAEAARALVEAAGGAWQVPVLSPRGSVIIWASSVVHSARYQLAAEPPDPAEPWRGWRGVVYLSYRPRTDYTKANLRTRVAALEGNRVTNHWGTRLFPVNPLGRYGPPSGRLARPEGHLVTSPRAVYAILGAPELAPGWQRRLAGYAEELRPGDPTPDELAALAPLHPAREPPAPPLTDREMDEILEGLLGPQ